MECIVLAGGMGTRLRSEVADLPKAMAPVAGRPFLNYLFRYLEAQGVGHVILSLGYRHEAIEEWVDENPWKFDVSFSVESHPLGTGGAILQSLEKSREENPVVLNGDTFFDIPLRQLLRFHTDRRADLSVALCPMRNFSRYGSVETEAEGRIAGFREKTYRTEGLINGGVYALRKAGPVFDGLEDRFSFEKEVLEKKVSDLRIFGVPYERYFIDIGIPEDYAKAGRDFREMFHER